MLQGTGKAVMVKSLQKIINIKDLGTKPEKD